jgi:RluA family pseudouridine synthase
LKKGIALPLELLGDIKILYEEGPCMLVYKPAGLLTQAPPHIESLELKMKRYIRERDNKPGKVYLGVPHRLDRPVSGVMVLALHQRAAKRISDQFQRRDVNKTYWACVQGVELPQQGTWVDFMCKVPGEARSEICDEAADGAKRAVLHYRVLQQRAEKTWLEIDLETGRTHQIRLQCGSRKVPIVGDLLYGSDQIFGEHHEDERRRCIALHARHLHLRHPMLDKLIEQTAQLPSSWAAAGISLPD